MIFISQGIEKQQRANIFSPSPSELWPTFCRCKMLKAEEGIPRLLFPPFSKHCLSHDQDSGKTRQQQYDRWWRFFREKKTYLNWEWNSCAGVFGVIAKLKAKNHYFPLGCTCLQTNLVCLSRFTSMFLSSETGNVQIYLVDSGELTSSRRRRYFDNFPLIYGDS